MLRVLTANNVHVAPLLAPHALAPIAQLLDGAAHLHAARLLPSNSETAETRCEGAQRG
jgi:hypothetical protein